MTAAKKAPPKPPPSVTLKQTDGRWHAVYVWHLYRFMMSDGRTIDVEAVRDDSELRGAVLAATKAEAIAGVVRLNAQAPPDEPGAPS